MLLSPRQAVILRDVLAALHLRDEDLGLLPAVDRGPPKGLLDATVRAVTCDEVLPDLRQLPPTVAYAAEACRALAAHPLTAGQVDGWLARNLAAALDGLDGPLVELPLPGCRSHEDVRNRLLVEVEDLSAEELEAFDEAVRRTLDADA